MLSCNMISCMSCVQCIYTIHSQPSYCLTLQYHPLLFWVIDKLCQPAIWYHVVVAPIPYTVNPPTVWPSNIIHCGLLWQKNYASLQYDIMCWMHRIIDKLCQHSIWYHVVNAPTWYAIYLFSSMYSCATVHNMQYEWFQTVGQLTVNVIMC